MEFKRCLVRLQKGVSKTSKGHLLQAQRALIASRLLVFKKPACEKLGQKASLEVWSDKICHLHLDF